MLNYIWAGLIIISISFALGHDIHDEWNNNHNNGIPLQISFSQTNDQSLINLHLSNTRIPAYWKDEQHSQLIIPSHKKLPESWSHTQRLHAKTGEVQADIKSIDFNNQSLTIMLPEIHWVKIHAITQAAFDMSKFAVTLAIGLAGIMALWLGLMRITEKSGLIFYFVKVFHPLLRWLFPDIPKNHPALGSISLNLAANVLGLGNAATPLGIKAMQQLQSINQKKEQASNSMCMFLALNTSSVQLLPPVTLIAIMGTQVSELIIPIILATSASTLAAVITAKSYARLNR